MKRGKDSRSKERRSRSRSFSRGRKQEPKVRYEPKSLTIQKRNDKVDEDFEECTWPIIVRNLPTSVDHEQLKKAFKDFGRVLHSSIAEENGMSRGYGIVEFASKEAAKVAVETMDRARFNGKEVRVRMDSD